VNGILSIVTVSGLVSINIDTTQYLQYQPTSNTAIVRSIPTIYQ